ncbi:MAG: hypothetical protein LW636_03770 [Planctomycetaceae bacterium]|nr:hypothetical protein [Planctomycetaceae bacterium]
MNTPHALICPYCSEPQAPALACKCCGGRFDVWSLHATANDMGAWFVRDTKRPHFVGFGYEALVAAIRAGEVGRDAIVRGPTTGQYWTLARRVRGIAHLFGRCHACQSPVNEDQPVCAACGAGPLVEHARGELGLPPRTPSERPMGARPDLSGFVADSGILVVRIVPAPVAAAQPSATAAQARPAAPAQVLAGPTPQPATLASVRSATTPSSPAADASPRPAGLSVTDAALTSRVRALETKNRFLLAVTALCFATAVLLGIVFLASAKSRDEAVAAARKEGAESVRSEFERRRPVTESAKAPLPDAPEPPPSGAANPAP